MSERTASIAFFDCDAIAALVFGQITPDDQGIAFALVDVHRNATRSLPSSLPMTLPKNSNATLESESFEPAADTGIGLFDNWFDPIESGVRGRVREFIEGGFLLLSSGPYPDQKPRGSLRVCW
jgi:hypothetical protein